MNWTTALIHGLIWSIIWGLPLTLMEIWWPQLWVHDYPKELQKVIILQPLAGTRKTAAYLFVSIWMLAVIAFFLWSVIYTYRSEQTSFWILLLHAYVLAFIWNLIDLIIMDWVIFCTWHPPFIVLPGSEGHSAYRDYKYHFIGFLKGCVISLAGAVLCSVACYAVLNWFIW